MDTDWTKDLTPDEACAALEALNASHAPITAREATEFNQTATEVAGEGATGHLLLIQNLCFIFATPAQKNIRLYLGTIFLQIWALKTGPR